MKTRIVKPAPKLGKLKLAAIKKAVASMKLSERKELESKPLTLEERVHKLEIEHQVYG